MTYECTNMPEVFQSNQTTICITILYLQKDSRYMTEVFQSKSDDNLYNIFVSPERLQIHADKEVVNAVFYELLCEICSIYNVLDTLGVCKISAERSPTI